MGTGAILVRLGDGKARQRRLVLGAVASCGALAVFLFLLKQHELKSPPAVPAQSAPNPGAHGVSPHAAQHSRPTPLAPESNVLAPTPVPAPEAAEAPRAADDAEQNTATASVRVHLRCSPGVGVWIDQRKYGNCRSLELDLVPGQHAMLARKGRHVMQKNFDLQTPLAIHIDGSRRHISMSPLR